MPYGSICCTYHQQKYSCPNRSKTTKNKSHTKDRSYLSEKGVQGKRSPENGPKAEKDKTERAAGLGRRTDKRGDIEKWDQTDSPEIPGRGETSEIHGLPGGPTLKLCKTLGHMEIKYRRKAQAYFLTACDSCMSILSCSNYLPIYV